MLKSIDPILNADVLYALRAMGHGDDLIICDTNFPADSVARETAFGELLRIDNVTAARAAKAILSVFPLDSFVDHPASRMQVGNDPADIPAVVDEALAVGAPVVWVQLGIWNEDAARAGEAKGLTVVMDRCLKIEHARFSGRLNLAGFNTGLIASRRRRPL